MPRETRMNGESEDVPKMPTQVGLYRIVRPLGRGGMGAVYEVEHMNLGTRFALKTFTLDHGYVKLLKDRFLAEGRILARLRHPNLVRVFDLDIDEATETPYFVMDLVQYKDGESYTLADLEQGGADEEHLSRWFSQLCSALDYIHSAGIVHRDIKLGNILLDSQSGVVLSDFGVSRFCDKELRRELALERTIASDSITTGNLVMGTSGYMAPEVKRGEDATPAADAWSLGIVFFRLLTGVWYEPGTNIWSLLDPFNEAWRDVLHGLLAENPADRPATLEPEARKVAEAIGPTMADGGQKTAAPKASDCAASRTKPTGRSLYRVIAASVAAVLLLGGGAILVWRFLAVDDEPRVDDLYSIPSCIAED